MTQVLESEIEEQSENPDLPLEETLGRLRKLEEFYLAGSGRKFHGDYQPYSKDLLQQDFRRKLCFRVDGERGLHHYLKQRRRNARGGLWLLGKVRLSVSWEEVVKLLRHSKESLTHRDIVEGAEALILDWLRQSGERSGPENPGRAE